MNVSTSVDCIRDTGSGLKLEPKYVEIILNMQNLELRIEYNGVCSTILKIHSFQKF